MSWRQLPIGPVNDHPGFELLIPRYGKEAVFYKNGDSEVEAACNVSGTDGIYAHHVSVRRHLLRNTGEEEARFQVIRLHRNGPTGTRRCCAGN
jgi:hypothetical protein